MFVFDKTDTEKKARFYVNLPQAALLPPLLPPLNSPLIPNRPQRALPLASKESASPLKTALQTAKNDLTAAIENYQQAGNEPDIKRIYFQLNPAISVNGFHRIGSHSRVIITDFIHKPVYCRALRRPMIANADISSAGSVSIYYISSNRFRRRQAVFRLGLG